VELTCYYDNISKINQTIDRVEYMRGESFMDYGVIVLNIFLIFALVGVGFIAGKCKLFSERASKDFSSILIEITLPLSIFSSMLREFQMDLLINAALLFGLGFVFLAITGGLGYLMMKILKVFLNICNNLDYNVYYLCRICIGGKDRERETK